jgi:tetratricopeptide (TPR) repeat protein
MLSQSERQHIAQWNSTRRPYPCERCVPDLIHAPAAEMIRYLEGIPETSHSAVLEEKRADLYFSLGRIAEAIAAYQTALRLDPTPQQRIRVSLRVGLLLDLFDENEQGLALYQQFLKDSPDYPDLISIYQKLVPLAKKLGKQDLADQYERELQRLTPPPTAPAATPSDR